MNLRRRDLLTGAAAGAATAMLGGCGPDLARRLSIGHTGITWGYGGANAEQAIADVARLGFHGFESFGSVIEYWETRGGIGTLLDAAELPLIGAYCPMVLTDPTVLAAEVERIARWAALIRKYGGSIAVIGPDNVDRTRFDFAASRADIAAALSAIGHAVNEQGLVAALHQHTGSCITTLAETEAVVADVDGDLVSLCPDTGELLKAGIDPVAFVTDHIARIAHVHVKDFNGGAMNEGYCPVGTGRVDVAGVLDALERGRVECMVMAELNPDMGFRSGTPGELAARSREKFVDLGYRFGA